MGLRKMRCSYNHVNVVHAYSNSYINKCSWQFKVSLIWKQMLCLVRHVPQLLQRAKTTGISNPVRLSCIKEFRKLLWCRKHHVVSKEDKDLVLFRIPCLIESSKQLGAWLCCWVKQTKFILATTFWRKYDWVEKAQVLPNKRGRS